jgi:hypothetical protein
MTRNVPGGTCVCVDRNDHSFPSRDVVMAVAVVVVVIVVVVTFVCKFRT